MNIINNPFNFLGVSQRDKIAKILDKAEEKSLFEDPDVCNEAKNVLTNTASRIKAEINWLPGVTPSKIAKIVEFVEQAEDLNEVVDTMLSMFDGCLPIVYVNIDKTLLETKSNISADDMYDIINDLCEQYDTIDKIELFETINSARKLCGMATLSDISILEEELHNFYDECLASAIGAVNTLTPMEIVQIVTDLIDNQTLSGECPATQLVYSIVDTYEIRTKNFVDKIEDKLYEYIKEILNLDISKLLPATVTNLANQYISELRYWDKFAQPIQLRCMSKGEKYNGSKLGEASRQIAIKLWNNGYSTDAENFLKELNSVFAEIGSITEMVEEDFNTISEIKRNSSTVRY